MEDNKEQKNSCDKCGYFEKHYISYRGHYNEVKGCGHCLNRALSMNESTKIFKRKLPCAFWEPIEIQKEQKRKAIKTSLEEMAKRLDEIYQILKNDE